MAKSNACWGIDIGQCALKAIRCRPDDRGDGLVAEAFDYIEYPKILSQPDADPQALVADALKQFLSRNSVRSDQVALSVPGQNGLTRFIKLPPVETKKIPDIVKYEAKQQIPFDLEDVIWDYQPIGEGPVDEMATDMEVGLFAMKRDQVFRAIQPLRQVGVELDVVQLTPLAVYNAVAHGILPRDHDPTKSVVVLSMGTETTDLVVTNGQRVWQRSIPIGGSHFTKQLTKELKLTFSKAEHLKRNAQEAEDPKLVFQAMRSVFSDMVTEVQRSIGYFRSIHRDAEIERILVLGNAFKLPGLAQYLSKNLGFPVRVVDHFEGLGGATVVEAPSFKENVLSFAVAYGLAVQGLGRAKIRTNLVPRELVRERLIRQKKPGVLAACGIVLAAMAINYTMHWSRWVSAHPDKYQSVFSNIDSVVGRSQTLQGDDSSQQDLYAGLKRLGEEVIRESDGRLMMLELVTAINQALPNGSGPPVDDPNAQQATDFSERKDLFIQEVDSEYFADLSEWYTAEVQEKYAQFKSGNILGEETSEDAETADPALTTAPIAQVVDPLPAPANPNASPAAGPNGPPGMPANPAAGPVLPPGPAGPPPQPGTPPPTGAAPAAPGDPLASPPPTDPGLDPLAGDPGAMDPAAADPAAGGSSELTGPGWVIQIKGWHLYNGPNHVELGGAEYVRRTLLQQLEDGKVSLPLGPGQANGEFTMKELGISHPILASYVPAKPFRIPNYKYDGPGGVYGQQDSVYGATGQTGGVLEQIDPLTGQPYKEDPNNPRLLNALKFEFTVQFVWQESRLSQRLEQRSHQADVPAVDAEQGT